jgi:Rad3-related DNA helicase
MNNLQNEISRELPNWAATRTFADGEPILSAFECALLERETDSGFIYSAVNLRSGKSAVLSRRSTPMTASGVNAMVERMRKSRVAGASRIQADREIGQTLSYEQAVQILRVVFREILPKYGYNVREEQITLAEHILDTIVLRNVTLAEAGTGSGKTLAYIVPAVIAKRGRLNDERNMSLYPGMQYADMPKMPIVIATSSIALQKAIITEYIPELSRILLENGVTTTPLTAVIRKGREHYVCKHKLLSEAMFHSNASTRRTLERLLMPNAEIDLAEVDGLDARIKKHISVPSRCFDTCKHREDCPYMKFRENAQSYDIDIQVCNHNYLLADTLRRANDGAGLIPNYQALIVDEAHKFIAGAARTMYGSQLPSQAATDILNTVGKIDFKRAGYEKLARRTAKNLSNESKRLFANLTDHAKPDTSDETEYDTEHATVGIDANAARSIRNIHVIAEHLILLLQDEMVRVKAIELFAWVRNKYKVETDSIDLKKLLYVNPDEVLTREEQEKRTQAQIIKLHRAICELPKIKQAATLERMQRQDRRYSYNPERQAIANEKCAVFDSIWRQTQKLSRTNTVYGEASEYIVKLIRDIELLREQAEAFADPADLICWLETDSVNNMLLGAIPKDIGARLYADQWRKSIPTILTSGTLSASGAGASCANFAHTKRTLGLERLGNRVTEICTPSPFNYRENALLYISRNVPLPDNQNPDYIIAVTDETERLIRAAHGHTAVLFTSYNVMGRVYAELQKRGLPFPLFRLERSSSNAIEQFRQSGNGVLFASGSLWEGIDRPGDALSMLIIVKLPFQVPDAIAEYEQALYPNFGAYFNGVIFPEMLIKLKQGFGRGFRNEDDTCVVAICDCRVNTIYREPLLDALPPCDVTDDLNVVTDFYPDKKSSEYWD